MARRKGKNPWTSTSEVLLWLLFVALLFPAVFAGYAVGHYTSLGKPPATVTVNVGGTVTSPTTTAATTTKSTSTTTASTSSSGGNAAAGKAVFASNCSSCHTFTAAGSSGTIGPNLDTAPATDSNTAGMALDAFIKESITDPSKYIAKGYTDGIMPSGFGTSLTSKQIDDLVAFISANTQQ